jgi:hypothetical protein
MVLRALSLTAFTLSLLGTFNCKSPTNGGSTGAKPSALPSSSANPPAAPESPNPRLSFEMPSGPRLAILAGEGVGPIRIGATVKTIERLMDAPCEIKTADKCRYIARAVEFELKDGAAQRIVIHRHERPAGPDAQGKPQFYGFFNGGIPPFLGFGMLPKAIIEVLGAPTGVEKVSAPNEFDTVERDSYPGMVLEYDRYKNGNLILGGVIITKHKP